MQAGIYRRAVLLTALLSAWPLAVSFAAEDEGTEEPAAEAPECPECKKHTFKLHKCICEPFSRAGYPHQVARYARPSNTPASCGYYVGGGARGKGACRHPRNGTWGWDYVGILYKRRVALNWWYGRRFQGGAGTYKSDGPHLLKHE